MGNRTVAWASMFGLLIVMALANGCVRRTLTITTEPPGARVFLNDREIGRSRVTTDFLWYGDYDVVLRKEGYESLQTHALIKPPWYQFILIDFVAEVLWPGLLHDQHVRHFSLKKAVAPDRDELIRRAIATRDEAFDIRK